ncbi:MAG: hypothetical protein ACHQM6_08630 [Candidatus Kapaibacterium sp.]
MIPDNPFWTTYQDIVNDYKGSSGRDEELELFRGLRGNIGDAILHAGLGRDSSGMALPHMNQLDRVALFEATIELNRSRFQLLRSKNLQELFNVIGDIVNKTIGVAAVYHYDTALRIGFSLDLYPELVYLQAGALEGAVSINPNFAVGDPIPLTLLPEAFSNVRHYEAENILCMYRQTIRRIRESEIS